MTPIRVTAVLTHPVQYYAPWFRWITAHVPSLDLQVVYASSPDSRQQGAGFGREFTWDLPLTTGYSSTIVRDARPSDRFDTGHFRGLDVPAIGDAIRDSKPDVVVVFGWYSVTLVRAIRAARRLGVPVLYHGDTNLQSAPGGWRRWLWVAKTRWLLSYFDGYLAVGVRSAAFLRYFGVPDARIFHTPHCVDNDRFADAAVWRRCTNRRQEIRQALGLPIDSFIVLFAGKLEAKKHPMDLVHALAAMTPPPHLAIAGTGPLESAVVDAAAQAGVGVTRLGFVNQSEMPRVYAAADCLALPSDARETWGLVVNEALAAGLPCVVSDQAGCAPDLAGAATGAVYADGGADRARAQLHVGVDRAFAIGCAAATISRRRAGPRRRRTRSPGGGGPRTRVHSGDGRRRVERRSRRARTAARRRVLRRHGARRRSRADDVRDPARRARAWRGHPLHRQLVRQLAHRRLAEQHRRVVVHRLLPAPHREGSRESDHARDACLATLRARAPGCLRDAFWFRATHVFVSDHMTVMRNAPALCAASTSPAAE